MVEYCSCVPGSQLVPLTPLVKIEIEIRFVRTAWLAP